MPSYIVRPRISSKDGSKLGANSVMVTASSERAARESGAETLGLSVQHVEAVPYSNPHWAASLRELGY